MDVFAAVSNPTRRRILDLLSVRERPAGELVRAFPRLPQPAVSRHLRILRLSGLVRVRPLAQQRIYALEARNLREVAEWLERYREFWPARLDALEAHLDGRAGREGRNEARP